jgi:hypothetical protein
MKTAKQNIWDTAKATLRGKFIARNTYIKKKNRKKNNLMLHLKIIQKQVKILNPN